MTYRSAVALILACLPVVCLAGPQDRNQLTTASPSPNNSFANTYWGDRERGWFWYEDPVLEEPPKPEKPAEKPVEPPAKKEEAKKPKEIVELERLQKELEESRRIAIMNPTESNVLRYMQLEARMVRQASYFADVAQKIGWTHSELDMSLDGRPVNPLAIQAYNKATAQKNATTIESLAKDHAIFFFFRGDCPYCHAYAPILRSFAEQHGFKVVAISVDGGGIPAFPDARADNGIAATLGVNQVPATFLAQPSSNTIIPLGYGVLSTDQLVDRMTVISSPETQKTLPGLTQRLSRQ